jgi:ADP-ribosylglycohydrolase
MDKPINDSKGCGGVIRMASVGLFYDKYRAFQVGMELAALTNGHKTGYRAAGTFAVIIASIIKGKDLEEAVIDALAELRNLGEPMECNWKLLQAIELAKMDIADEAAIRELGDVIEVVAEDLVLEEFCGKDVWERCSE